VQPGIPIADRLEILYISYSMELDEAAKLRERVKELTCLHRTARILQDDRRSAIDVMGEVVATLPSAWQYPETAMARIRLGEIEVNSTGFTDTKWSQRATFSVRDGHDGEIQVCYGEERPLSDEGPFLSEERELIESLAEMLRAWYRHHLDDSALQEAHDDLERQVRVRTAELASSNEALQEQIRQYRRACAEVERHQQRLRRLASQSTLTEERERRAIAQDIHDHIGQALAFMKVRLRQLGGNSVFSGHGASFEELERILEQTICYTRDLTVEISPPVLYELGLESALRWLADRVSDKHGLAIHVRLDADLSVFADDIAVTVFKSVSELLSNITKHAQAGSVTISSANDENGAFIEVQDDGVGFDADQALSEAVSGKAFGLFSIRERFKDLGGSVVVDSRRNKGSRIILHLPPAGVGS
jgi:signal transduction histidine kinase